MPRSLVRSAVAAATLLAAFTVLAGVASAHVTVNPNTATKGGFTKLTFRMPNEEATASSTKLDVAFPTDHPIAFVGVKPHAGWTATVTKTHLATPIKSDDGDISDVVTQITWTADTPDAGIKPGYFDEFDVSVGPLPTDADKLVFKAVQTYSNGDVVRWIDEAAAGAAEPAHPAPVLTLTAATPAAKASSTSSSSSSGNGKGLAVIALVVAIAAALLVGFGTLRRR